MFTWICPNCGREVPPSYSECPSCAARERPAEVAETPAPVAQSPPPQPPPAIAKPGRGLPAWLMSILFAILFIGIGAAVYWGLNYYRNRPARAEAPTFEAPGAAPAEAAKPSRLQKFIEVTGVRITQNARKGMDARFLVVNHSAAEIADLAGTVTLRARGGDSGAGSFAFRIASLGPYESKEVTAPVDTNLRAYELPDWQNLQAEVRITSPE